MTHSVNYHVTGEKRSVEIILGLLDSNPLNVFHHPRCDGKRSSVVQVGADDYACEAEVVIPLDTPTLLMQEIAERVAVATMIRDTPGESCLSQSSYDQRHPW